jgi:gliding motility associated protien GldN
MNYVRLLSGAVVFFLIGNAAFAQNTSVNYTQPQTGTDIAKLVPQDTYALPWAPISYSNILWRKRVWRTIDTRVSENKVLSNSPEIPNSCRLAGILVGGIVSGKYQAYSAVDDHFTTLLTKEEVLASISEKVEFHTATDPLTGDEVRKYVNYNTFPEMITKYIIKEDWLYLKNEGKIIVRIVGIAPVREAIAFDGTTTEKPLFWLYYPDIRNFLAQYKTYSLPNENTSYNWDELFEGRHFDSKIDKVMDETNPNNMSVK